MTYQTGNPNFLTHVGEAMAEDSEKEALRQLVELISPEQYVGDLITLDYNTADILIHDTLRQRVDGLPHGCLLIASRITPADLEADTLPDNPNHLLIRVSESVKLAVDNNLEQVRFNAVQRSNDTQYSYDESNQTDQFTLNMLRYSGIRCRILGTYRTYLDRKDGVWKLHFGSDIADFSAGQGMKIYKPRGPALSKIINHQRDNDSKAPPTKIGRLRYSSAIKEDTTAESVEVYIRADDFIAQRTALFGMTRSGKSNTTKIIASALFKLRSAESREIVGQLIFDPNGEYANDNPQDQGCIRNIQHESPDFAGQVHTYGSHLNPHYDPDRTLTKFNFFGNQEPTSPPDTIEELDQILHSIYQGKQIVDASLSEETAGYIQNFCNASLSDSAGVNRTPEGFREYTRFRRRLFIYRSILAEMGFAYPTENPTTSGLFGRDVRKLMQESEELTQYADLLNSNGLSWNAAANFVKSFAAWTKSPEFRTYNTQYASTHEGRNWTDPHLDGLLDFYTDTRARAIARGTMVWHDLSSSDDYAEAIVRQVRDGKMVIVDQLLGNSNLNRLAAERIVRRLLSAQQDAFITPKLNKVTGEIIKPPHVIVYAEEAHTLLPKSSEDDNTNIWAVVAKEGAKFNMGMVYSTQEPSSLQTNILKNTENWFIGHLNNTDETNQLSKFYDFRDFASSMINVSEAGLTKVKTKSRYYTIPVQIDEFEAPTAPKLSGQANGRDSANMHNL